MNVCCLISHLTKKSSFKNLILCLQISYWIIWIIDMPYCSLLFTPQHTTSHSNTTRWNVRNAAKGSSWLSCVTQWFSDSGTGISLLSLSCSLLTLFLMISFWLFLFQQNIIIITILCFTWNVSSYTFRDS